MNKMNFTALLTSRVPSVIKDENGNNIPIKMEDANGIITNIKKYAPKRNRLVVIANDSRAFESNDERAKTFFKSISLTHLNFKEKIVLDDRNASNAAEILSNADMIWLWGGQVIRQTQFLKKIKFQKFLSNYTGLVLGASAGAMNLCKDILNYPEEDDDLQKLVHTKGLGYFYEYIIPHCDGFSYPKWSDKFDSFQDFIRPYSFKHDLLCIPDGSYILLNKDGAKYYGDIYLLRKGEVYKKV